MKLYNINDVINAECNLEPIECIYCGSLEVVYDQYIGDGVCQDCSKWQLENQDNN